MFRHAHVDVVDVGIGFDIGAKDGGDHLPQPPVLHGLANSRTCRQVPQLSLHLRARQNLHELLGPLEGLDGKTGFHPQPAGFLQDAANQADGPPPDFFRRFRAHQLGIGEDLHGSKPLPADGLRTDGMAVAEIEDAGGFFHPAEAVVHKRMGRPERAVDAIVFHLGDLPQKAKVLLQTPGNRPVRQVIDQAPAANAQVGLQDQIQIGQAGPPAPVGIDVPVQQISHPQSLAQIVGGPQHRHRTAPAHQQRRDRLLDASEKQPLSAQLGPALSGGPGQQRIALGTTHQNHRLGFFPCGRAHGGGHLEQPFQHGGQF